MYYITKKDSETGKKINVVQEKKMQIDKLHEEFFNKHSLMIYFSSNYNVICLYLRGEETPKIKHLRRFNNVYFPHKGTIKGKEILKELEAIPYFKVHEIDSCISNSCEPVNLKGFDEHTDCFGFIIPEESTFIPPVDCTKLSLSEYVEIFPFRHPDNDLPF